MAPTDSSQTPPLPVGPMRGGLYIDDGSGAPPVHVDDLTPPERAALGVPDDLISAAVLEAEAAQIAAAQSAAAQVATITPSPVEAPTDG